MGAPALAGQVKNQPVFVPVHKPFKAPKVSISIAHLQPDAPRPSFSLLLSASGEHREESGFGGCGQRTRLLGLQKSCQLQMDIL